MKAVFTIALIVFCTSYASAQQKVVQQSVVKVFSCVQNAHIGGAYDLIMKIVRIHDGVVIASETLQSSIPMLHICQSHSRGYNTNPQ